MPQRSERIKSLASVSHFRIGALLVQPERLAVVIDEHEITLEPRLMEVLVALAERAGEVVSADQLLIEVWRGTFYGDNPVHRAIAQLRRLIGDSSRTPIYIETIRKRGYRLIAKVLFPENYRRAPSPSTLWAQGNPYVGLTAFDRRHAEVFFGRSRMIAELLTALRRQIDSQRRFVLLVGASGSGKTSLLRAGAIPLLQQEGGFDGLQSLAVAYCDLAGCHGGDVLLQLAASLSMWSLQQRPLFTPQSVAELAEQLRQRPEQASAAIADAFLRVPSHNLADRPHAHLLLVIDHGEALVAAPGIDPAERAALSRILTRLCESPHVAVTMIARSDFYPRLIEAMPQIVELKAGDGHVDVLTPRPGEIAQIIRAPAMLAGLVFEEDAETSARLDDTLRDAALEHADALPLLQHALHTLYERKTESGELTFRGYREIGGLIGALAHRAEEVYASLPALAQQSLDRVLALLVVIQPDNESVSAQRAFWSALDDDPARMLAETFVRARLFVGELRHGRPVFGVAHEALLRQWPRAREWTQDNRRVLQARARLRRAATRWIEERRSADYLLNPGQPLIEAREAAKRAASALEGDERDFLRASERQNRFRRGLRAGALAALIVFSGISVLFGLRAQNARREAEQHREGALQLADFMLGNLRSKLAPIGKLDLLDAVGDQAMTFFATIGERGSDKELLARTKALRQIGEVRFARGKLEPALASFQQSLSQARALHEQAPENNDYLFELGQAEFWVGYVAWQRNDLDGAESALARYMQRSRELHDREPDNVGYRMELAYAYINLGSVARERGLATDALEHFQASEAIWRRLAAADPDNTEFPFMVAETLSWAGSARLDMSELHDSEQAFQESFNLLERLHHAGTDRRFSNKFADVGVLLARVFLHQGKLDEATRLFETSRRNHQHLIELDPSNADWRRGLYDGQRYQAELAQATGHLDSAASLLASAYSGLTSLAGEDHSNNEFAANLAMTERARALHLLDLGHIAEASAEAQRAQEHIASAMNAAGRKTVVLDAALIAESVGRIEHAAGRAESARSNWSMALNMLNAGAAPGVINTALRAQLACHFEQVEHARELATRLRVAGFADPRFPIPCINAKGGTEIPAAPQ